ncbi:MAG TPA: hypothetical protein VM491_05085 [Burkholderiaceae bacterium]|jgi:hypothetical protein|nr:hypothetical protein [Burkholderiaceae bacterium]
MWAWMALVAAPTVMLAKLALVYSLVPWACGRGSVGVLHAIVVVALAFTVVATIGSWSEWQRIRAEPASDAGGAAKRQQFLAVLGALAAAIAALSIVAHWIPQFAISPCLS